MSKGPSRQKHSVSSSASRRYDQSLERVFNNHNTHSFSGACEHVSNSEKAGEQHRSQRERRHRHHCREHDSAARRHESSSGESLLDDHYHSAAIRKHQEVDSTLSSYLYKSPREPSKFSDSAYKTAHVNKISDRHSASVKSPRINRASPPSAHRNRSPITSISTARSDNRNSTKMAGDSPHNLLRVRPDNRKRSYQDSSSTAVAANIASMSNKKMHSFAVSNCRGYDHASSTLDHRTAFSKGHTSAKAAKTRASLSELHDEVPAATNDLATNSPAKCPTDNQLRQIPVPITSPFAYNDPLLLTQVFSKFQQPLPASPPSPSSSFDGSFFDESKIPRRSGKPNDSPGQRVVHSDLATSSYPGATAQPLLNAVGGCSHPDGHHRSSGSGSNWHHQADDSGAYVPGVDLLPATECPPSPNHLPLDGVNPVDSCAGRVHSIPSQEAEEEGEDDHHFAMDLASSPPTHSPQSSPLLPPLFAPLSPGQQQRHQQQSRQQQHQQSGNVSVGVLVSSQTSPYPIAATKRSKADNGGVTTSQEQRLEIPALSPAPTSSMSGPSAGIELSKAAKSHNQRLKQQRSKVLPVKRITLPPLHLHLSEDGSSPLPPGWQRAPNTSRRDSRGAADSQSATSADGCNYAYYYYHTRTRQTRWDPPVYPWDADPEDKLERSIDDPEAPYNWGCAHRFAVTHDEIEAMYTQLRSRILERQCMELLHEQAGRPEAPQGAQEQNFAIELYTLVHNELRQFRDARAKLGRITSDEDLYFLTKKLAQSVILKEMQKLHQTQAANSSSLFATSVAEVTPTIRQRASSYVRKYMEAKGPCYRRRAPPPQPLPPVPGQHHHHQQLQNPRSRQPHPLPSGGGDDVPRSTIPVPGTVRLAPVPPVPQHHMANAR